MKIYPFFLFFIFQLGCNFSKEKSYSCNQVLEEYTSLIKKITEEKNGKVLSGITALSNTNDKCVTAYFLLGDIYLAQNNFTQAKQNFLSALKFQENNIYSLYKLGLIYHAEKNYDSAILLFRTAAKQKTTNGFVLNYSNEYSEIINRPHFDIQYSEIIFSNALASYNANNLLDARNELNYCITQKIHLDEAYYLRGLIYFEIKYYNKACNDMFMAKSYGSSKATEYIINNNCRQEKVN